MIDIYLKFKSRERLPEYVSILNSIYTNKYYSYQKCTDSDNLYVILVEDNKKDLKTS